jgi:hypothetical protein
MSNRIGVLYITWGNSPAVKEELDRSIASVEKQGLPVHVQHCADLPGAHFYHKPFMSHYSPFENTLFLDTDTEVLGDLTYGFRQAERFGMALCYDHSCTANRWYGKNSPSLTHNDVVEYNTGVVFFNKTKSIKFFKHWEMLSRTHHSDQATFAKAIDETLFNPFVLPAHVWNYRVYNGDRLWSPVKIWHTKKPHILTDSVRAALTTDHGNRWYEVPEIKKQNPSEWEHNILRV